MLPACWAIWRYSALDLVPKKSGCHRFDNVFPKRNSSNIPGYTGYFYIPCLDFGYYHLPPLSLLDPTLYLASCHLGLYISKYLNSAETCVLNHGAPNFNTVEVTTSIGEQSNSWTNLQKQNLEKPQGVEQWGHFKPASGSVVVLARHLLYHCKMHQPGNAVKITGWWLGHPSEKYESQLGWLATQYMGK